MNHETSLPTAEYARSCIREYIDYKSRTADLAGAILETALYLEDLLGITVGDGDLNVDSLGSAEAIIALAFRKLGVDS